MAPTNLRKPRSESAATRCNKLAGPLCHIGCSVLPGPELLMCSPPSSIVPSCLSLRRMLELIYHYPFVNDTHLGGHVVVGLAGRGIHVQQLAHHLGRLLPPPHHQQHRRDAPHLPPGGRTLSDAARSVRNFHRAQKDHRLGLSCPPPRHQHNRREALHLLPAGSIISQVKQWVQIPPWDCPARAPPRTPSCRATRQQGNVLPPALHLWK